MSIPPVVHVLGQANFEEMIDTHEIVIIDFWAQWCAPCKQFAKTYEKVASECKQVLFASVNIEEQPDLAETFEIRSIPHLMVFKQGIVIYSEAGSMPESTLKELVEQALKADVSALRQQIDEEE